MSGFPVAHGSGAAIAAIDSIPNQYGLPVDMLAMWTRGGSNFCDCLAIKQIAPLKALACELEYQLLVLSEMRNKPLLLAAKTHGA